MASYVNGVEEYVNGVEDVEDRDGETKALPALIVFARQIRGLLPMAESRTDFPDRHGSKLA
jgi:hypothetical protein